MFKFARILFHDDIKASRVYEPYIDILPNFERFFVFHLIGKARDGVGASIHFDAWELSNLHTTSQKLV